MDPAANMMGFEDPAGTLALHLRTFSEVLLAAPGGSRMIQVVAKCIKMAPCIKIPGNRAFKFMFVVCSSLFIFVLPAKLAAVPAGMQQSMAFLRVKKHAISKPKSAAAQLHTHASPAESAVRTPRHSCAELLSEGLASAVSSLYVVRIDRPTPHDGLIASQLVLHPTAVIKAQDAVAM